MASSSTTTTTTFLLLLFLLAVASSANASSTPGEIISSAKGLDTYKSLQSAIDPLCVQEDAAGTLNEAERTALHTHKQDQYSIVINALSEAVLAGAVAEEHHATVQSLIATYSQHKSDLQQAFADPEMHLCVY